MAAHVIHIVDDDASVRRSLERLMRSAGYVAAIYASADEFLAVTRSSEPACVIADISMPGRSGPALVRALRARGDLIPVILITANDNDESQSEAHRSGAAAHFRKPVDDQALIDAIEHALS
jgi:FixJ family two-component response regulator